MKYTFKQLIKMDPIEVYELKLKGEIKNYPKGYFKNGENINYERAAIVLRYLIEEKLKWAIEDVPNKISADIFRKYGLGGMLQVAFNNKVYDAVVNAYPGCFKPWIMHQTPDNYWNKETAKEAVIWLLEENLQWSHEDICEKFTRKVLEENGLRLMLKNVFDDCGYKALDNAYPGRFKPWEIVQVPFKFWTKETGKEAMIWLIEEKLKWNDEQVCKNLTRKVFAEYKLRGMLELCFNNSTYLALEYTYPGRFKPWELKQAPNKYWNDETTKEAVIWLIEEKLKWSERQICNKLTKEIFAEYGLSGVLNVYFKSNVFRALDYAYPGKYIKVGKIIKLAK